MRRTRFLGAFGLAFTFSAFLFSACADLSPVEARLSALEKRSELDLRKLQLKGKDGKVKASLYLDEKDQPILDMYDKTGKKRLMLRLRDDESPTFVMWGREHKGTAFLAIDDPGAPAMVFFNGAGQRLVDTRKNRPIGSTMARRRRPSPGPGATSSPSSPDGSPHP